MWGVKSQQRNETSTSEDTQPCRQLWQEGLHMLPLQDMVPCTGEKQEPEVILISPCPSLHLEGTSLSLRAGHRKESEQRGLAKHLPYTITFFFSIFVWKGRERERERSSANALLKCLQQLGLGKAEARRQELNPGLTHSWKEPTHMNHHLLPARLCISRKL